MLRRRARQSLLSRLRVALAPPRGRGPSFSLDRLRLRSRDALVVVSGPTGAPALALRLVPRDPAAPTPAETPASRRFLLLPATAAQPTTAAEQALVTAVRARLAETEHALSAEELARSLGDPPTLAVGVPGDCEQACVFCRDPRPRGWWRRGHRTRRGARLRRDLERLHAALAAGRPDHDRVVFQGEDCLAFPGLSELVREADRLGYEDVAVLTPGARLGEGALVERLIGAGLDTVEVALYGATAADHDRVTRTPGAFARLRSGLDRARRAGVQVIVHTALARETLPHLAAIATLADERGWCFERAEGLAADRGQEARYCACAPTLAEIRRAVASADRALPRPFTLVDVPDCALPPGSAGEPTLAGLSAERRRAGADRWPTTHASPCLGCARRSRCNGIGVAYLGVHGAGDLRPFD